MHCSGCGKDIPFTGDVCPYCQRDKSKDQAYTVAACTFGVVGGAIGYSIFGFWGAFGGFIVGCIIAVTITSGGETKPPEVRLTSMPPLEADLIASKLAQLKTLHDQGLLTAEEFARKKADILEKL